MPRIWRKTNNNWEPIKTVYRKTGGTWQSVRRVWRKTNNAWQLVFQQSLTPSIESRVEISKVITSTQTVRLTGKLYHWLNSTSVTYQFARSTNAINYFNISGASGTSTNPSSGGSNTNDQYVLLQSDVTANTTNYYIYISRASNSTFNTEQTSTSDFVIVEAPRNLTLSNSRTSSSITISWNNDIYSGRYEYQYKASSSGTWNTAVFLSPGTTTTSFTISGLSASTNYDFRVRGWTGTSNSFGYFGNWAEVTVSTLGVQAPNPPTNLSASSISKDSFFLSWSASTVDSTHDAPASYDYGVNTSNVTAPATEITGTSGSNLNPSNNQYKNKLVADTNRFELIDELSAATDYYGWVRAKNSGGSSAWAVSAKITTLALKPPKSVTSLTHVSADRTQTSLKFTWTKPVADSTNNDATHYIYHISSTNSEPALASYNGYLDGGATETVTVSSLSQNTTYYFWIRAGNNDGYSGNASNAPVSGTTLAQLNPPGAPTSAAFTIPSPSGLTLSWTQGTGGTPTAYEIAISTSTTPPTLTSISTYIDRWFDVGNVLTYRPIGLSPNTLYYGWVRAKNADGTSGNSNRPSASTRSITITNPKWNTTAPSNFERNTSVPYMRWGWDNGTTTTSGSGTGSGLTQDGFFYEIYTTSTGTTLWDSGYRSQRTTNSNLLVNGANRIYVQNYNNTSNPPYTTASRFGRIQISCYDFDFTPFVGAWTGRI
jgi:hypothetical protein